MGCSPSNGNSSVVTATTVTGGTTSAAARPHSRDSRYAAPTTRRNSPETGLPIVDSVAHTATTGRYRPLTTASTAPRAKTVPSMNVERPDTT